MNLYEIEQEIMNCIDMETGEIIDIDKLNELEIARDTKVENIALWIKNLNAEAAAYKVEKDSFAQKQKTAENKVNSLKQYLSSFLNGSSYKSNKVSIAFRSSKAVDIYDVSLVPDDYLKFAEPTADKTAIKKAIETGVVIPGAVLIENSNIQIK